MNSLILKYFTDSLNETEIEQLLNLLEKPENLKKFQAYAKENYHLDIVYDDVNEEAALLKVKNAIKNQEQPVRKLYWRYAAAAVVIGVLTSSYFFKEYIFKTQQESTPIIVNNNIKIGTDKATLTLEDGSEIILEKGQQYASANLMSNGEELVYSTPSKTKQEIAYNYLTIPRGGQYHVKLSDGSEVWLNSESKLKYPVNFIKGTTREVELVYGEAYFDVSPSTNHNGSKFIVSNNNHDIEVIGTKFNVKAYNDETNTITTLVEGKVNIKYQGEEYPLIPNQQSNLNRNSNTISFNDVDVFYEISWVKGVFSFNDKSLKDIMKVLSRWYDFEVEFKSKNVENELFVGVLGKNEKIEDILSNLKNLEIINDFKIDGKKIIIE